MAPPEQSRGGFGCDRAAQFKSATGANSMNEARKAPRPPRCHPPRSIAAERRLWGNMTIRQPRGWSALITPDGSSSLRTVSTASAQRASCNWACSHSPSGGHNVALCHPAPLCGTAPRRPPCAARTLRRARRTNSRRRDEDSAVARVAPLAPGTSQRASPLCPSRAPAPAARAPQDNEEDDIPF